MGHIVGFANTSAMIDDPYDLFTSDLVDKITRLNENHPVILKSVDANDFSDMDELRHKVWQNTDINDKDNAMIILVSVDQVKGKSFGLCTGPNLNGERMLNTFRRYKDELTSGDAAKISHAISQSLDVIKDYPKVDARRDKLLVTGAMSIIFCILLCGVWFICTDKFSIPRLITYRWYVRQFDELYKYWETSGISSDIPSLIYVKWFRENWVFDNIIARDMWETVMKTSKMQEASSFHRLRVYRSFVKRNLVFDFVTFVSPNLRKKMFKSWSKNKKLNYYLRMLDYKAWCNEYSIKDSIKNYCGNKDNYTKVSRGYYSNGDIIITRAIYNTLPYENHGRYFSYSTYSSSNNYLSGNDYSSSSDSGGDCGGGSF